MLTDLYLQMRPAEVNKLCSKAYDAHEVLVSNMD